jgi:peptide chain release factor 2
MQDLIASAADLRRKLQEIEKALGLEQKKRELGELSKASSDPALWQDKNRASSLLRQIGDIKAEIEELESLEKDLDALVDLEKEGSQGELGEEIKRVSERLERLELKTFFSGEYDSKDALVSIHPGQGGVEAMDWAEMLLRMYMRFFEKKGFKAQTIEYQRGEEAGIKTATLRVEGPNAYGLLKAESGTHRLVRQSPFNADKLRQTSFALVEVLPQFEEKDLPDIGIKEEDLDWQFFRSSSQGGQNVQKVSTAVRLTHRPTGIVVTAQSERFQEQNRKIALGILRAKLWQKAQEQLQGTKSKLKGQYRPASWGTQIRSYVLHPYKMVKDLRTGVESSSPDAVLAGELDRFIEAEIRWQNRRE